MNININTTLYLQNSLPIDFCQSPFSQGAGLDLMGMFPECSGPDMISEVRYDIDIKTCIWGFPCCSRPRTLSPLHDLWNIIIGTFSPFRDTPERHSSFLRDTLTFLRDTRLLSSPRHLSDSVPISVKMFLALSVWDSEMFHYHCQACQLISSRKNVTLVTLLICHIRFFHPLIFSEHYLKFRPSVFPPKFSKRTERGQLLPGSSRALLGMPRTFKRRSWSFPISDSTRGSECDLTSHSEFWDVPL